MNTFKDWTAGFRMDCRQVLVTGATGQLGRELIPRLRARGDSPVLLVRDPKKSLQMFPDCPYIVGDVTEPFQPLSVDAVYHLAADINLGRRHEERTWTTNYTGTQNVLEFCALNGVKHLFYVSTAYTAGGRNPYEQSKAAAEEMVRKSSLSFRTTIFKPGIIMPCLDDVIKPATGAVYQFARGICTVHRRAEIVRRAIEGTLRLPVIEPKFRLWGNDDGRLNLIPVDVVADFIAATEEEGTFWLTHPDPPTVGQVARWIGNTMYVDVSVEPEFQMSAVEKVFHRLAAPFMPYLEGDSFHSDIRSCPAITADFIRESVRHSLL